MSTKAIWGLKRKPENRPCIECSSNARVPAELLSIKCISVLLIVCFFGQVCVLLLVNMYLYCESPTPYWCKKAIYTSRLPHPRTV
jgi:hypothetical protein